MKKLIPSFAATTAAAFALSFTPLQADQLEAETPNVPTAGEGAGPGAGGDPSDSVQLSIDSDGLLTIHVPEGETFVVTEEVLGQFEKVTGILVTGGGDLEIRDVDLEEGFTITKEGTTFVSTGAKAEITPHNISGTTAIPVANNNVPTNNSGTTVIVSNNTIGNDGIDGIEIDGGAVATTVTDNSFLYDFDVSSSDETIRIVIDQEALNALAQSIVTGYGVQSTLIGPIHTLEPKIRQVADGASPEDYLGLELSAEFSRNLQDWTDTGYSFVITPEILAGMSSDYAHNNPDITPRVETLFLPSPSQGPQFGRFTVEVPEPMEP